MAALKLSPIGLGTGRLASLGSGLRRRDAQRLIQTALDHGIRLIDTADTYGSGDSERVIGDAVVSHPRNDLFLITKAGFPYVALPALLSPLNQVGKKLTQVRGSRRNFSKSYLIKCAEASLKRLRIDYLDAFLLHSVQSGEPSKESWEALETIRIKGISRFTGVSTNDPEVVREGLATGQVMIVETPVSIAASGAKQIAELCAAHNVPLVGNEVLKPVSSLSSMTAEWNSLRSRNGVDRVSTIHLLIAYALSHAGVRSVVIGSTNPTHLVDNLQALNYLGKTQLFEGMKGLIQ